MLIGELSKRTGLSRDTIRFYEKQGLIAIGKKERRFNNYKEYSGETLERLRIIKRIKGFGFTLNETAGFLEMIEGNSASCRNVAEKFSAQIAVLDRKIRELKEIRKLMQSGVEKCLAVNNDRDMDRDCPILSKDVLG